MVEFLQFEHTVLQNIPKGIVQPRRAPVYVGFQCHQGCKFCYYKGRCNEPMFSFEDIVKQIDFEYAYGIREFEVTGGEPSEHRDIRKVCEYIKSKGQECKIAIITNGGLASSDVWDIIDEVLVSYHVDRAHAFSLKGILPNGCTFSKAKRAVDIAHQMGVLVRTNTVCASFNLSILDFIVDEVIGFHPAIINFLPVNLFDQASSMSQFIDYDSLRPALQKQVNKIEQCLPGTEVNIRYMPFCEMRGYEHYIMGNVQHIFDAHDWNRELDGIQVIKMSQNPELHLKKLGAYGSTSVKAALETRKFFYEKPSKCLLCKFNLICDGVEKTSDHSLFKFCVPQLGKIEKNAIAYMMRRTTTK